MNEPRWVDRETILLLHLESLSEHGGSTGMRDEGLFESALARPRNQIAYEPESDIAKLAAAYGFGLAKNHPFVDGNKRIAFIATALFPRLNGYRLTSGQCKMSPLGTSQRRASLLGSASIPKVGSEYLGWLSG